MDTCKTFGVGLKGVGLSDGKVLLNHTLEAGDDYAYLSHLWMTYMTGSDELAMSHTFFDYYLDGEETPSISVQPAYAAGDFFPAPGPLLGANRTATIDAGDGAPYSAGGKMGKGSLQGGWYNHHKIPFRKSVVVKVRIVFCGPKCLKYFIGWVQIRGVVGAPLVLEGGGELPRTARLELHVVNASFDKSSEKAVLAAVPAGRKAVVYLVQWACVANKSTGYIEGQFHAITKNESLAPNQGGPGSQIMHEEASAPTNDIVLGTGVEDYFESAFRFSADYHGEPAQFYTFSDAGLVWFNRSAELNMEHTIESEKSWRFFCPARESCTHRFKSL
eukprot:SAG31_NODE_5755_length_2343_cov_1.582888_2_plen_331_part_00